MTCNRSCVLLSLAFSIAFSIPLFAASLQDDAKPTKDALEPFRFVGDNAEMISIIRPAMIMSSDDYRKLKRKIGPTADLLLRKWTKQYFKFGLAKLDEIDSLTFASWQQHRLVVLRTLAKNTDGFDLATHGVDEEIEFKDQKIFRLKKPLDRAYRYCWIANDKTIVWGTTDESVKAAVTTSSRKTESSHWFGHAKQFASDPVVFVFQKFDESVTHAPPQLRSLNEIKTLVGGVDLGETTKVTAVGICKSTSAAVKSKEAAESAIDWGKTVVNQQMGKTPLGTELVLKSMLTLLESAKVKTSKNIVRCESSTKFDFDALAKPLNQIAAASKRSQAANNLRQNALAMHNFHSAMGGFPTSVMVHPETGKKYSWRIAILPFMERNDLYQQYDFSQEWDSPHNLEVTADMPDFFRADSDDEDSTNTSFFLLTGAGSVFGGEKALDFQEMADGSSNTIMAVEAIRDVHWSKPEDIVIDPKQPFPNLGGFHEGGFNVTMMDGSVRFMSENVAPEVLRKLFNPTDGAIVTPEELNPPSPKEEQENQANDDGI